MNMTVKNKALSEYKKAGVSAGIESASPHRLIQMLMQGALDKLAIAKGFIKQGNVAGKGQHISWAIAIIDGLKVSLDKTTGGEIADNLEALYDYMQRTLLKANLDNNIEQLDEVMSLMLVIKDGWDNIPEEFKVPGAIKRPLK